MPTVKELREKRAPLAREIRRQADALHASGRSEFSAEEKAGWEKVNGDYNVLTAQIERMERVEKIEAEQAVSVAEPKVGREDLAAVKSARGSDGARTAVTDEMRALAFAAWARTQFEAPVTRAQREACRTLGFNPRRQQISLGLYRSRDQRRLQERFRGHNHRSAADRVSDFRATLSTQVGPSGGYLIPPETMQRSLEINMLAYGGLLQVADTLTTKAGERMSWPTADDTGNKAVLLGQSASIGTSVDPSFAKVFWDAYKWSSQPILVPYELLQDSEFDLAETIGEMFGERFGRGLNDFMTTGTGTNQPKGIVTAASLGITAASSTAIAADEIIRLEHSVDPAYRPNAGYMMHDTVMLSLRLLKDGVGRYLWQSGFDSGTPDTLNNRPTTVNQSMASSVATTNKTILFGDFKRYKVRRVGEVRMYRLEERYRDTDQDGFVAFMRADGNLLTAGTAPIKYLLQP